jgi:hypothetical protein
LELGGEMTGEMTGDMTMPRDPSGGNQHTTTTSAIMPEVEYTPIQTFLRDLRVPLNQRGLKQAISESSLNGDGTLSHEDLVAFARWISGESALVVENAEKSIENLFGREQVSLQASAVGFEHDDSHGTRVSKLASALKDSYKEYPAAVAVSLLESRNMNAKDEPSSELVRELSELRKIVVKGIEDYIGRLDRDFSVTEVPNDRDAPRPMPGEREFRANLLRNKGNEESFLASALSRRPNSEELQKVRQYIARV